jgi:uncharacterized protein YbaR (Trm112 family)
LPTYNACIYFTSKGQPQRIAGLLVKHISAIEKDVFDQQLVQALQCPQNQSSLTLASSELVEQINRGIIEGQVVNLGGRRLERSLDAGLVRAAGDLLYPVIDAIPVMLPDEALELSQVQEEW